MSLIEKLAMLGAGERSAKGDYQTALKAGYAKESDEELNQKRIRMRNQVLRKVLGGAATGGIAGYLAGSGLTRRHFNETFPRSSKTRGGKKAVKRYSRIGGGIVGIGGGLIGAGIGSALASRSDLANRMRAAELARRMEEAR